MKKYFLHVALAGFLAGASYGQGLDMNQWPPNTDFDADVHFWAADDFLINAIPPGEGKLFDPSLIILNDGDQLSEDVTVAGLPAKKSVANYFNAADELYFLLPDLPVIDVLVLYFANAESKRDNLAFRMGTLPNKYLHTLEDFTLESVTDQYEWRLFRLDNSGPWAGMIYDDSEGNIDYGGLNGGTIRFQNTNGVIFRAVAFGPEGAFGEPEEINTTKEAEFNPDDFAIMAEWDIHNGVINGLDVYRDESGDQETLESEDIGPADDKRKAIRPAFDDGSDGEQDIYVNWEILNEHFGPTSQPSAKFKVVAEYYDDPALAGVVFGPEVYVTAGDDLAFFSEEDRTALEGSGKWREAVWYVSDVKLKGVNVDGGQAAARFTFGGPVYISRLRLGVIRTSGVNEGVDPIPDAYPFDPDPYGIYAELDLDQGVVDNLDVGSNGGDQEYIIENNIGPAGDQRTALRPALEDGSDPFDRYVNFSLLNEVFGPSDQPNAVLKAAVDYYDDPNLAGERFGPEVYQSDVFGTLQYKYFPGELRVTLEGSGEWKTAVWRIDNMNFSGVNQGPQAAARFWFSDSGAIYISRVRYAVIRPAGVNAGVDMLAEYEPIVRVSAWELY
ncbi:MAG: hypothetical protein JXR73_04810 [Candidatus Omnitrophica bacterium]|nr:hypothetical protein [Candidatus Omnitrophota bacterium]